MTLIDQLKHAVLTARRTGGTVQVHATPAGDITGFTVPARARLVDLDATPDHDDENPAAQASAYATGGIILSPPGVTADRVRAFLSDEYPPIHDTGPSDQPYRDSDQRWHADEARALAKLAELTGEHGSWAAAHHMDWST